MFTTAAPSALVLLALALMIALVVEAVRTARLSRAVAEGALQHYAAIAAWELARSAEDRLIASFASAAVSAEVGEKGHPDAPSWYSRLRIAAKQCLCLDSVRAIYHVTQGRVEAIPQGTPPPSWAIALLTDQHDSSSSYSFVVVGPGGTGTGVRARNYGFAIGPTPRGRALVAYATRSDGREGGYLVELPPSAYLQPLFTSILQSAPLLPEALLAAANDSALAIEVRDSSGAVVLLPSRAGEAAPAANVQLSRRVGSLRLRVAVRRSYASRLLPNADPATRLSTLVALVVLVGGLLAVGVWQHRRQTVVSRMRAEFVAGVSHELRTPLAQIKLFAELLSAETEPAHGERRRFARIIEEESQRLTHLVSNVLAFPAQQRPEVVREVDLSRLVHDTVKAFEPLASSHACTLVVDAPKPVLALADIDGLRQVVLNLLDNAIKYGPHAGAVRVEVSEAASNRARIVIDDEGPGVPNQERPRIFEAYYRSSASSAAVGGAGIGLAVVRELVHGMGGTIVVGDAPSGGARFTVELPSA